MKQSRFKILIALLVTVLIAFNSVLCFSSELSSNITVAETEAVYTPQHLREYNILNALGVFSIFEDGFKGDAEITRAEISAVATRMLGIKDGAMTENIEMPFTDVLSSDTYAYEIFCASKLGIMTGYDGEFSPDDKITQEQFIKVVVEILGFGVEATKRGGFPEGYKNIASQKGILNGVDYNGNTPITQDIAVKILYNSLDVELAQFVDGNMVYTSSDETVLSRYLKVELKHGIVKSNAKTDFSGQGVTKENVVRIGDEQYYIGESACDEYIGYNVEFYCTNQGNDDCATILYVEAYKNKVTDLEAEEITDYSDDTYSYIKRGSSKEKNIKVPLTADVIYNGVVVSGIFTSYHPEIGNVKLIDNDADGKIDIVLITAYDIFYVESNNSQTHILSSENGMKLDYSDIFWSVNGAEGKKILPSDVTKDTLFLLAISRGMDVVSGFQVNEMVAGVIKEFLNIASEPLLKINGIKYRIHSSCESELNQTIKLGESVEFYVYENMLIKKHSPNSSMINNVGYLISAGVREEAFEETVLLKMLLQTGEVKVVTVSKKAKLICYGKSDIRGDKAYDFVNALKYDLQLYKVSSSSAGMSPDDLLFNNVYKNGTEKTCRQPVVYKLNEAGELVYLEISPEHNSNTKYKGAIGQMSDVDGMNLVSVYQGQYTRFDAGTRNVADDSLLLDNVSFVIDVPIDYEADDAYKIYPIKSLKAKDVYFDCRENQLKLYRTGNDILGANIMVGRNLFGNNSGAQFMIVDCIYQSITDAGEECYLIAGVDKSNKTIELMTKDKEVFDSVTKLSTGEAATITEGDLIKFTKNTYGMADLIEIAYDAELGIVADAGEYPMAEYYNCGGQVYIKSGNIIGYYTRGKIDDPDEATGAIKFLDASRFSILVFDSNSRSSKLVKGTVSDLKAYKDVSQSASKILAIRTWGNANLLVIYD